MTRGFTIPWSAFAVLSCFLLSACSNRYVHPVPELPSKLGFNRADRKAYAKDDVEALVTYGQRLRLKGRPEWALDVAGKVSESQADAALVSLSDTYKAAAFWEKALGLHPWRLDLRLELARLHWDLGDFEAQYSHLAQALKYAERNRSKLTWEREAELPEEASFLFARAFQDYAVGFFNRKKNVPKDMALRLSKLYATFYPENPWPYQTMGIHYYQNGNLEAALKYFLLANQKDPTNSPVLGDLAGVLEAMGKRREARIYYRRILELNNDLAWVEKAKQRLGKTEN